jgi:putative FmdB family regulatory protein
VPIYEYRCDECGDSFEILQRMADDPLVACEKCGGTLRKVLHPVAIHFKGSGFYTTDYGRGSGRRAGREGASDAGESPGQSSAAEGDKPAKPLAAETAKGDGKPKEKQKAT